MWLYLGGARLGLGKGPLDLRGSTESAVIAISSPAYQVVYLRRFPLCQLSQSIQSLRPARVK
jgi:hypothetical protein